MKDISVIILAGGESRRMEQPKAFLKFDKNRTFIEKITDEYIKAGINKIILVINAFALNSGNKIILSHLDKKITTIYNKNPEKGRLYSISLGLIELNKIKGCFIQNIDNPFVNSELLKKMIPLVKFDSYVSPTYNKKGGHPILISKSIYDTIIGINDVSTTLRNKLERFNKIVLPSNEQVLININTVNDYTEYFSEKHFK
jgi:molybdenum cofactor cytidylyltransferase